MSRKDDLEPFADSLNDVFARLGLPDPILMSKISEDWDGFAGSPWTGRSKPLYVRGKTLVVEASTPSMVAFLKYGSAGLIDTLEHRLGKGLVEAVEVIPPSR